MTHFRKPNSLISLCLVFFLRNFRLWDYCWYPVLQNLYTNNATTFQLLTLSHYHFGPEGVQSLSSAGIVPLTFSSWGKLKPFCCFAKRPSLGPFLSQIPCSTLSEDKVCAVWFFFGVLRLLFLKRCPDLILLCLIALFDTVTISSLIDSYTFLKIFTYLTCSFPLPTFNSMLGPCNHSLVFSLISLSSNLL